MYVHKCITTGAPAKLLLLGEYLAILGESALGISLDQHMTMKYNDVDTDFVIHSQEMVAPDFYAHLRYLCQKLEMTYPQGRVEVQSNIPVAAGLGSSAAFSVCLAKILLLKQKCITDEKELSPDEVWKMAHSIETFFHKKASGVDTAIASFGGTVLIERSCVHNDNPSNFIIEHITLPLEGKLSVGSRTRQQLRGIPEQMAEITKLLQEENEVIREWIALHRKAIDFVRDFIREQKQENKQKIDRKQKDTEFLNTFGTYITNIHRVLSQLHMSTKEIDAIIQHYVQNGAFGGKITGACFGGSFYILSNHALIL